MLHFARWKAVLILLISGAGILFSLPNFVPVRDLDWIPSWLPHEQLVLGLDLQGGVHLLWEVDTQSVIDSRLNNLRDDVRSTLRSPFS